MRGFLIVCLLAAASSIAHADVFAEAVGGGSFPIGDSNWTNKVDKSPDVGVRAGWTMHDGVGAMVQADWTPLNPYVAPTANLGATTIPGYTYTDAMQRFRVLADATFQMHLTPWLVARARAGVGVDIMHETVAFSGIHATEVDPNIAVEVGGGLWWSLARSRVAIGGELALPFSNHSRASGLPPAIPLDRLFPEQYASWDIELELGVRVTLH